METNLGIRRDQRLGCINIEVHSLVVNRTEEVEARNDFFFWGFCFDDGTDDSDIDILGAHVMRR